MVYIKNNDQNYDNSEIYNENNESELIRKNETKKNIMWSKK